MRIIDLTENYRRDFIQVGDRQAYENSFPELFDHYYRFWTKRELAIVSVDDKDIKIRKAWVNELVSRLTGALAELGIELDSLDLVYLVGVGTTNGHAFWHDGEYYVWLPLETYTSQKLVEIFVTHEIAHALHYRDSPEFYFKDVDDKLQIGRQLVTEGLATYATKALLHISELQALWADFLNDSDALGWRQKCEDEKPNLYRLIIDNYYRSNPEVKIFYAAVPDDIYRYRSGYYIGLKLIEDFAKKAGFALDNILKMPRKTLETDIFEMLKERIS